MYPLHPGAPAWRASLPVVPYRPWISPPYLPAWAELGLTGRETEDAVVYTLNVPGFRRRDLAIEVRDGRLIVRGERTEGFWKPRSRRSFVRSFTIPETLEAGTVQAELRDSVLSITVEKKPSARARRIPINGVVPATAAALPAGRPSWWDRVRAWFGNG